MGSAVGLLLAIAALQSPAPAPAPPAYSGLGLKSVPAELLEKYAPRPFDPRTRSRVEAMMDVRAPGMGLASPRGDRLYFTWTVTGTRQVWRLDGPERFPVQLTGGEDVTSVVATTLDGRRLVLQRDRKGEENPGLYLQDADGGPLTPLQHQEGVRTEFQRLSDDGGALYFRANDVRADAYAVYRYDLKTGERARVFAEPGLWNLDDVRPDGRLLLRQDTGNVWSEYSEFDPASGRLTPLFGQGEKEEYEARYGAAGEIVVRTNRFGDWRRLYRVRAGKFEPVGPEHAWDVEAFDVDPARTRILYSVNEGGYTRLFGLDARTYRPLAMPRLPKAERAHFGLTTHDGRFTSFAVETARAPQSSFLYDWKKKTLTRWVVPSAPEVDTSRFAVPQLEYYPARDGTKIPMFVRRPASCPGGPCPVVVDFHGGPEGQALPGFNALAQLFVDAGMIHVAPNVRGSDGYGRAWLDADNGPRRLAVVSDIEDCARHLRSAWAQDGKAPRIGIFGGSYGGYSALLGMTMFAGAYDVGVSVVGISNLLTFLQNTAPYRRILRTSEYGDPEKDREALLKLSPVTYVDRVRGPLLIIQGATDPRVPAGESIQIHEALTRRGIAADLIIFPDEGHGAQKRENRVQMFGQSLLFLQKHLQAAPAAR